jgi:rubredoxin
MREEQYVSIFEDDEPENVYCPMCEKIGYKVRLGPKITLQGETRQPDADNWMQCPSCGWLCPIYATEPETEILETLEIQESPFENKFEVTGVKKRTSKQGRKNANKKRRKKQEHKDKDIQMEIDHVGEDRVKVLYDSNP